MPRHTLKLLALLTVFAVTPATANRDISSVWSGRHHTCPHERAAAAARAGAIAARLAQARKATTRITLTDRVTIRESMFDLGGGPAMLRP